MVIPHAMHCIPSIAALFIILYSNVLTVNSFNLDIANIRLYHGQENSDFGFSVALYINEFTGNKVIVGAPKANTSNLLMLNISNSGAVYRCPLDSNRCRPISIGEGPLAKTINRQVEPQYRNKISEQRSGQRLGASVVTGAGGRVIAACAPLYVTFGPRATKREPTGDCWVSKDGGSQFVEVSPCFDQFKKFYNAAYKNASTDLGWASYHKTGHGMCGFSVALGPRNELGVGAPGNYYFHGSLYSVAPQYNYRSYISTSAAPSQYDDSYMSWDIKYGEFDGDNTTTDYAVSAPRASSLKGKVLIWSRRSPLPGSTSLADRLVSVKNITGEQAGAYFGYALAVGSFDGMPGDDIAVGAPLFADYNQDMAEIGQVVIFSQERHANAQVFRPSTILTGKDVRGRFGLSLANVGDLNIDGFDDLMIGAPYGGKDGRGVVFLYSGSASGLSKEPIQVIRAEDISRTSPPLTFGWSIAGRVDVDGNKYDDVAIGAYRSDMAVLLKTRPIIDVQYTLRNVKQRDILLPVPCSKNSGVSVSDAGSDVEIEVEWCVTYEAMSGPSELTLTSFIKFDSANNNTKRAYARLTRTSISILSLRLRKGETSCDNLIGYLQPANIRDKTSPLNISMTFELPPEPANSEVTAPPPVLNQLAIPSPPLQLKFLKNCDLCNPDLRIAVATQIQYYILGTEEKFDLDITLSNAGEDSYLTSLNITLPDDVSYVNVVLDDDECLPIACQQMLVNRTDVNGANYITCDVGNPFPQQLSVSFTIRLRMEDVHKIDETELSFAFNVGSNHAADINPTDNSINLSIPLRVETSIFVTGKSFPADAIIYNNSHISSEMGPIVSHKYEVYTTGPSVIGSADLVISWPMFSSNRDNYLLYLYKEPEIIQGEAKWQRSARIINPQNVTVMEDTTSMKLVSANQRFPRAAESLSSLSCSDGKASCVDIHFTISNLRKEQSVIITIHSYLWMSEAFKNLTINYTKEAVISSMASAAVVDVPYIIKPQENSTASFRVKSYFEKYRPPKVIKPVDWKWIVIGVGCGLVLLIVIIIILWKCGFFQRYRPYAEAKIEKHKDGQPHEVERLYSSYR